MSLPTFWEENKASILKVLSLIVLIPLLIPVGMLLFTVLSFITSAALFVVVVALVIGGAIMAWTLLDDYFRSDGEPSSGIIEKTIIIESRRPPRTEPAPQDPRASPDTPSGDDTPHGPGAGV